MGVCMSRMTYTEQLKHPKWQKRRLEILNRANFKCESCDDAEKTLHVHHKRYRKGAMAWEYDDSELTALCEDCHANETLLRNQLDDAIGQMRGGDLEMLVGFAEAMLAVDAVFGDGEAEADGKWPLRSYEHAYGFLARALAKLPSELVYASIDLQPIDSSTVFGFGRDASEILQEWWEHSRKQLAKEAAARAAKAAESAH
jgi:hypothetical protein